MKILWSKIGALHPLNRGASILSYHLLKALKKRHSITFLGLVPAGEDGLFRARAAEYATEARWIEARQTPKGGPHFAAAVAANAFFSRRPFVVDKYDSRAFAATLRAADASGSHDLFVCDSLMMSPNFPQERRTPALLLEHNVESILWRRHAERPADPVTRRYFRSQASRMRGYEAAAAASFDGVVTVSDTDTAFLRDDLGLANVLGSVAMGVDSAFFSPGPHPGGENVVFVGSMDWLANEDAVLHFVKAVWPLVKARRPAATFTVVGRNPSAAVRDLARRDPSIAVTGTVDDVRPYLGRAALCVVPLRVGSGVRIKILESMAAGVPVVSTPMGAEGLGLKHGEEIVLAADDRAFAESAAGLLADPAERGRLAERARGAVVARFGWNASAAAFETYAEAAVSRRAGR